jgi:transcriptional regulator with XRE-family HTH domain
MESAEERFARAFGDALRQFLKDHGISVTDAAQRMDMNKQTLSTYWTDDGEGKRRKARAELLYLACARLGFEFEYSGYKISADTLNGNGTKPKHVATKQLFFDFDRQFKLTGDRGTISVNVRRPPGMIEVSLSLKAVS